MCSFVELHAVFQQFTLWQKVFRRPVLGKCLTFDKCCIVLAKQQYKHVTIWCLSSVHTSFLCRAFVRLERNQGTWGTHLKGTEFSQHSAQPAPSLEEDFSAHGGKNLSCYTPLLAGCAGEQVHFCGTLFVEKSGMSRDTIILFSLLSREDQSWIIWVMLLTEIQLW